MLIDINDAITRIDSVFCSVKTPEQFNTAMKYGDVMMGNVSDEDLYTLLERLTILTDFVEIKLNEDMNVH